MKESSRDLSKITLIECVEKFLWAFFLSVILLGLICDIKGNMVCICECLMIMALIKYLRLCNWKLFLWMFVFFCGILSYSEFFKTPVKHIHNVFTSDSEVLVVLFLGLIFFSLICRIYKECCFKKNGVYEKKVLLPQQYYDLETIKLYLKEYSLFGINGHWGSGKTFLLKQLQNDFGVKKDYDFIVINLLSCDLDDVEQVVFKEIDKLILKKRIYSKVNGSYRNIYRSTDVYLCWLKALFGIQEPSMQDVLNGYKEAFEHFDKKLVLVFEDIDRIAFSSENDVDFEGQRKLRKIFSIGESITQISFNISVVYTFDFHELGRIGFRRKYIEKYIPAFLNLKDFSWDVLLEHLLQDEKLNPCKLKKSDFYFLTIPYQLKYVLPDVIGNKRNVMLHFNDNSIRRMEIFLKDLRITFKCNPDYLNSELKKRITIVFCFMKNFYFDIFADLNSMEKPIDTFLRSEYKNGVQYDYKNICKLIKGNDDYKFDYLDHRIIDKMLFISIYGYKLNSLSEEEFFPHKGDKFEWNKIQHNEVINQTIMHLLASGTSELTDNESAVKLFVENVLNCSEEYREQAYQRYLNEFYNGDIRRKYDTKTVFLMGISSVVSIFRAMLVCGQETKTWKDAIDFLFCYYKISSITLDVIQAMCFVDISNEFVLFHMIEKFNKLDVKGNFDGMKYYRIFIRDYMQQLANMGIIHRMGLCVAPAVEGKYDSGEDTFEQFDLETLLEFTEKENKDLLGNRVLSDKYLLAINFIKKNIEVCRCDNTVRDSKLEVKVNTKVDGKLEYYRALANQLGEDEWISRIEGGYSNGEISTAQFVSLLRMKKSLFKNKDAISTQ